VTRTLLRIPIRTPRKPEPSCSELQKEGRLVLHRSRSLGSRPGANRLRRPCLVKPISMRLVSHKLVSHAHQPYVGPIAVGHSYVGSWSIDRSICGVGRRVWPWRYDRASQQKSGFPQQDGAFGKSDGRVGMDPVAGSASRHVLEMTNASNDGKRLRCLA